VPTRSYYKQLRTVWYKLLPLMIYHRATFILSLTWESLQPLQEACKQCQKTVTSIFINFCPQKVTEQTQEQKYRKVHNFWYIISCTTLSVGTLFYLTTLVSTSQLIMWQQTVHRSPLLQFAVSRGPRVLFHCTAGIVRLSVTIFTEGALNSSLRLADTCHTWQTRVTPDRHVVHYTSEVL
jgi:hypothetical protein